MSLTLFGWWTSFTLGNPEEEKVNWSVREVMERELEALKEMDEETSHDTEAETNEAGDQTVEV